MSTNAKKNAAIARPSRFENVPAKNTFGGDDDHEPVTDWGQENIEQEAREAAAVAAFFDVPKRLEIIAMAARAAIDSGGSDLTAHMAKTHAVAALALIDQDSPTSLTQAIEGVRAALFAIKQLARVGEADDFRAILMLVEVAARAWPAVVEERDRAKAAARRSSRRRRAA